MAIKIIDGENKEVSQSVTIAKYFRMTNENAANFGAQLKALTPTEKEELAVGAAKELGYKVVTE